MRQSFICIFAKYPSTGSVKTRMVPPLTLAQATKLYGSFLEDTIEMINEFEIDFQDSSTDRPGQGFPQKIRKMIFFDPSNQRKYFQELVSGEWGLNVQKGKDLGERLTNAFRTYCKTDAPVIIIGSDSPTLPVGYLMDAVRLLVKTELVIGPAVDGGFYLVGIKGSDTEKIFPALFLGVSWSTSKVLSELKSNINNMGIGVKFLPEWYDIDDQSGLKKLSSTLMTRPDSYCKNIRKLDFLIGI